MDKTIRVETMQDIKSIWTRKILTQAERAKTLVARLPTIKKRYNMLENEILELSTEKIIQK